MPVERYNPDGLHKPVDGLYTHVVKATGTLYRIGGQVAVSSQGLDIHVGDMAAQLRSCYEQIDIALKSQGLAWDQVVHLYTFTTDMDAYMREEPEIARKYFADTPPASTLLGVSRLVKEEWLVEVQADAVGSDADRDCCGDR